MKVFICVSAEFPRKNASANYVEYLGKAIRENKIDVYILGMAQKKENVSGWTEYQGMLYQNVFYDVSTKAKTLKARLSIGNILWDKIAECGIEEGDTIICYCKNVFMMHSLYRKAKRRKIQLVNSIVEWFTADRFKYKYLDVFNYWYYRLGFCFGVSISKKVIVISRELQNYFNKKGCSTLLLPPLSDPFEYKYFEYKPDDKIRIIYSGRYVNKDAMDVMIRAIAGLDRHYLEKLEFHITGNRKEEIVSVSGLSNDEWRRIEKNVIIHEWLTYEELIELYGRMHFLLIARCANKVTISNFPSKIPEMMCYGVIPIMTKVGDCPFLYLKDNEDSILFKHCTVEECKSALQRALDLNDEQRKMMQKNARRKTEELFYYKQWEKRILEFLKNDKK